MATAHDPSELLTIAEAAQRYDVGIRRLQQAALRGALVSRKAGTVRLVRGADVLAYITRRSRRGRPATTGFAPPAARPQAA